MALKRPVYHLSVVKSFPYISLSAISDTTVVRTRIHPPRGVVAFLIPRYDFLPSRSARSRSRVPVTILTLYNVRALRAIDIPRL